MVLLAALSLASCSSNDDDDDAGTGGDNGTTAGGTTGGGTTGSGNACQISAEGTAEGIVEVPTTLGSTFTNNFCKAVVVQAPSAGDVVIVAQNEITDEQLLRARSILLHYLTPVPGSEYGADKNAVFDNMAQRRAVLTLFNGRDDGRNPAASLEYDRPTQSLFAGELFVEGSAIYQAGGSEEDARDASFEEILHFVHDNGIGIDGANGTDGPLKATYQAEIRTAMEAARAASIWPSSADYNSWVQELAGENSLTQEYLAGVMDAYYGLTAGDSGNGGPHRSTTREELGTQDPTGLSLAQKFFAPELSYEARIDPGFTGNFSLAFDANQRYTHKSRYLVKARLLGSESSGLIGNDKDNVLRGNAGDNLLDGAAGSDIAVFSGNRSEYNVSIDGTTATVQDTSTDRDGTDTVKDIETLRFADGDVPFTGL
ncbi:MAG: hypothetical protein CSB44_03725 [Gammaproteobacteria bacterium]|nr:MAG: hypothetical protein CSB44_03725 [Gammaproteobacteria bacterium]